MVPTALTAASSEPTRSTAPGDDRFGRGRVGDGLDLAADGGYLGRGVAHGFGSLVG